jgi:hypothetical protein
VKITKHGRYHETADPQYGKKLEELQPFSIAFKCNCQCEFRLDEDDPWWLSGDGGKDGYAICTWCPECGSSVWYYRVDYSMVVHQPRMTEWDAKEEAGQRYAGLPRWGSRSDMSDSYFVRSLSWPNT